jgi:hypothetical protein
MSEEERTEELYELRVRNLSASDEKRGGESGRKDATSPGDARGERGAAAPKEATGNEANATGTSDEQTARNKETGSSATEVSLAKVRMQKRLPALDDDADVGVQKEHIVTRDGEADLRFSGVLLASAAPASAPKGQWQEYRIYHTSGGKHVFSKVARNVSEEEGDTHEAEIFDPSPSSVPSQLIRSAREIARSRPLTWMDAATAFFGYDPLAKALYRKLSVKFEEQIS